MDTLSASCSPSTSHPASRPKLSLRVLARLLGAVEILLPTYSEAAVLAHLALEALDVATGLLFGEAEQAPADLDGHAVLRRGPQPQVLGVAERLDVAPHHHGFVGRRRDDALAIRAERRRVGLLIGRAEDDRLSCA